MAQNCPPWAQGSKGQKEIASTQPRELASRDLTPGAQGPPPALRRRETERQTAAEAKGSDKGSQEQSGSWAARWLAAHVCSGAELPLNHRCDSFPDQRPLACVTLPVRPTPSCGRPACTSLGTSSPIPDPIPHKDPPLTTAQAYGCPAHWQASPPEDRPGERLG